MKVIIHADAEDAPAVLNMMLNAREQFDRHPERIGWGWHFPANDKVWFVRRIKDGLSACLVKGTSNAD